VIKPSAFRDYVVVLVGSSIGGVFPLLISALLARTVSVADFGDFSLAFALMMLFAQLPKGVDPAFLRFYVASDSTRTQQLCIRALVVFRLLFSAILLAVAFLASGAIASGLLNKSNLSNLILLAILGSVLFSSYDTISNYFQACEKAIQYAISKALVFFLVLVGIGLYIAVSDTPASVLRILLIHVSVFAVLGAYALGYLVKRAGGTLVGSGPMVGRFFGFSKWLFLVGVMNIVYQRADLFLLSRYASSSEVGIYAAASRVSSISSLLVAALYVVFYPRALKTLVGWGAVVGYLRESSLVAGLLLVVLGMASAAAGALLSMTFGSEYRVAGFALSLLLVSTGFVIAYTLLSFLLYAWDRTSSIFCLGVFKLLALLGGGVLLIPHFGINGAAWANILANFGGLTLVLVAVASAARYGSVGEGQKVLVGGPLPIRGDG